jgi:hypothetical protein
MTKRKKPNFPSAHVQTKTFPKAQSLWRSWKPRGRSGTESLKNELIKNRIAEDKTLTEKEFFQQGA